MKREDRKAAVAAYREQKTPAGVYLITCVPTGQKWAGATPNLSAIWNRIAFTLRQGGMRHVTLQTAWREHGADAFTFEVAEQVEIEDLVHSRDQTLKEHLALVCARLGAEAI